MIRKIEVVNVRQNPMRNQRRGHGHIFVTDKVTAVFQNIAGNQHPTKQPNEIKGRCEVLCLDRLGQPLDKKWCNIGQHQRNHQQKGPYDKVAGMAKNKVIETTDTAHTGLFSVAEKHSRGKSIFVAKNV